MQDRVLPRGVWAVALTPFHEDGVIDWAAYDALLDLYADSGLHGIFAACASSEADELSEDEHVDLTARAVERVGQRLPIVGGLPGCRDMERMGASVHRLMEAGAAAVVIRPSTLATREEDEATLHRRIERLLETTRPTPFGLYECPFPYHRLISAELFGDLAATGRFIFHKDTTCSTAAIVEKIQASAGAPVPIYNANMKSLPDSIRAGAAGYCGVATNIYPDLVCRLWRQCEGTGEQCAELHNFLVQAEDVFGRTYPRSAKRLLALQGLPLQTHCRMNVPPIIPAVEVRLEALLHEIKRQRNVTEEDVIHTAAAGPCVNGGASAGLGSRRSHRIPAG